METLKEVLMRRDKLTAQEAQSLIDEAREEIEAWAESGEGRDPEQILYEEFGLEPDFVFDIIPSHLL